MPVQLVFIFRDLISIPIHCKIVIKSEFSKKWLVKRTNKLELEIFHIYLECLSFLFLIDEILPVIIRIF